MYVAQTLAGYTHGTINLNAIHSIVQAKWNMRSTVRTCTMHIVDRRWWGHIVCIVWESKSTEQRKNTANKWSVFDVTSIFHSNVDRMRCICAAFPPMLSWQPFMMQHAGLLVPPHSAGLGCCIDKWMLKWPAIIMAFDSMWACVCHSRAQNSVDYTRTVWNGGNI